MFIGGNVGTPRASGATLTDVVKIGGEDITLGQKIKDESIPVVFAADQSLTVVAEGDFETASDHNEDDTHTTGAAGSFVLGVRNDDAVNTLTSANGDYSGLSVDSKGRLYNLDTVAHTKLDSLLAGQLADGHNVTVTNPTADPETGLAKEATLGAAKTTLDTIAGLDFATQTTLAAVLAKLIAAPSTEAKQDAILAATPNTLTGRLTNKRPQVGYRMWVQELVTTNIGVGTIMAEAPSGSSSGDAVFDAVFIPDAGGEWVERTGFAWDSKGVGW